MSVGSRHGDVTFLALLEKFSQTQADYHPHRHYNPPRNLTSDSRVELRTSVRTSNFAPIAAKLWENAFRTICNFRFFDAENLFFGKCFAIFFRFFVLFGRFWRSQGFSDTKISFYIKFCFRCTLPEVCTTKNRRILIKIRRFSWRANRKLSFVGGCKKRDHVISCNAISD